MKLSDFTLRQVALGVPLLGLLNWAVFQFVILPSMSADERKHLYPTWIPWPYLYLICAIFIAVAFWFVFRYRGTLATAERRIALFAMALGSICGLLMIAVIRFVWHI